MAEFFILRAYRRRKIGTEIAHQVWRRFPGPWQVRVMQANKSALLFWEQAVATFAPGPIHSLTTEKDGESWRVLTFTAAAEPRYRT
jgi:predicted acetyltransferase